MGTSFAETFKVDPAKLDALGTFNPLLDDDSPYYVDPRLLENVLVPEFQGAFEEVLAYFQGIIALVQQSKSRNDFFWNQAKKNLSFREVEGLCIGYSSGTTSGSGIGLGLADEMLETVNQFLRAGINDPRVFAFLVVVEEGIGADRMSDMVANILKGRLAEYSERVYRDLSVPTTKIPIGSSHYNLAINPHTKRPLLLVPVDLLNDLPSWKNRDEVEYMYNTNGSVRDYFNGKIRDLINRGWQAVPKRTIRDLLLEKPAIAREALSTFSAREPPRYDFQDDKRGYQIYANQAWKIVQDNPLALKLPTTPTSDDLHEAVLKICAKFKDFVENNAGSMLLRDQSGAARGERFVQKLFHAVARGYCEQLDLGLSPEPNPGRGPVDFKFNRGFAWSTLVEIKLSSSSKLHHGYRVQLKEYQKAEGTDRGIYLVVDYYGNEEGLAKLTRDRDAAIATGLMPADLVFVDARQKVSASKFVDDSEE